MLRRKLDRAKSWSGQSEGLAEAVEAEAERPETSAL